MNRTEKAAAGMLAGVQAGHAQAAVDKRLAAEMDRGRSVALLDLEAIRPRAGADTRPARLADVVTLAESIAAVGLVQALTVDRNHRLVAGLHRLAACRLLCFVKPEARAVFLSSLEGWGKVNREEILTRAQALPISADLPEPLRAEKVPCRVLSDLDAEADPGAALAAEAAENTARRDYTAAEVAAVADRLRKAGYRDKPGRPRSGERALRPALALVLGVDVSTIRRHLNAPEKPAHMSEFSEIVARLRRALDVFLNAKGRMDEAAHRARKAAKTLAEMLEDS
jgi:ParB family chromosome partitioning protein